MLIAARYSSAGSSQEAPCQAAIAAKAAAVPSSTSGYRAAIGVPQQRERPRSSSQLSTGTLSRAAIGAPQAGQALPGRTTDSPAGTRCTTTLRKEPIRSPSTAASTTTTRTGTGTG